MAQKPYNGPPRPPSMPPTNPPNPPRPTNVGPVPQGTVAC